METMRLGCRLATLLVMAGLLGAPLLSHAASPEQRCTDLGVNCLCSAPLDTTVYTQVPGISWSWKPGDTPAGFECSSEGIGDSTVERNPPFDLLGTSSTNLPAGNTVTNVLRGPNGHLGIWFMGGTIKATDPTARFAWRWYQYYSPDFQFANETVNGQTCNNHKIGETQYNAHLTTGDGFMDIYGFSGAPAWTPGLDCCNVGPGQDSGSGATYAQMRGKWWRIEMIVINRTGSPGLVIQVFRKNVTDNGPEYKVVDTSIECPTCTTQPWVGTATTALTPPGGGRLDRLQINAFRSVLSGGACNGYEAYSHLLAAAWSTNAGQRIGAAFEIEGGGVTPPNPPSNLKIVEKHEVVKLPE